MIKVTFKVIYIFYTFWGLVFHIFYFLGYLPNTRIIALFIRVVSQIFLFIRPNYLKMYGMNWNSFFREIVFHWMPVWIVPFSLSRSGLGLFVGSLFLYLWLHGPKRVIDLYKDKKNVLKKRLEEKK